MTAPIDIVRDFCSLFGSGASIDELVARFTDDAVYHNIPIDPVVGHDDIRGMLGMFLAPGASIEFRVRHIVAAGDVVLTERVDVFRMGDATIELPVMGTFEVRDGLIAAWRDYFDLNQYMSQLPQG
ncbi:MAG: limonene-1,2-epoxide hydrolase family protein [Actinomycetota bacterium]